MGQTVDCFWFFCLVPSPPAPDHQIFGFGQFMGAIAILIVVFQIVDFRYRFRLTVLYFSVETTLFLPICLIGLGLLTMELWMAQGWLTVYAPITPSLWQFLFGATFFGTFVYFTYAIFIRPPVFEKRNAGRFTNALYQVVLKGNDAELTVIADELKRSTRGLVQLCATREEYESHDDTPGYFAYNAFGIIANPKLCRHLAESAQATAIFLFQEISELKRYDVPIGSFCKTVTEEAILNKDSILHHESAEFTSNLIRDVRPWSKAIYGDYKIIQNMRVHSPLNLHLWSLRKVWDSQHCIAYFRVILEILKGYSNTQYRDDGTALGKAIERLRWLTIDLHREDTKVGFFESDAYRKLDILPRFVAQVIEIMDSSNVPIEGTRKPRPGKQAYIHQGLAKLVFELLMNASQVHGSRNLMWDVQHNTVWIEIFGEIDGHSNNRAIVQSLIARRFFEQIKRMEKSGPNYVGVRVVGIILNILGLESSARQDSLPCERAIYKFSRQWAIENYLQLNDKRPDMARALLVGSLEFDEDTRRIAKRNSGWGKEEEPREFLDLKEPGEGGGE